MKSYHLSAIVLLAAIAVTGCHHKKPSYSSQAVSTSQTTLSSVLSKRNNSITTATENTAKTKPNKLNNSKLEEGKLKDIDYQSVIHNDKSYTDSEHITLESLFDEFNSPVQKFQINHQKDISITCSEGTRIYIPKGSFDIPEEDENSMVSLHVQEYYGKEALLMGNLGTVSNEHIIESAGTINIEAFVNGKKVGLKKDKSIELGFPDKTGKEKKGMELFEGKKDKKGNINWLNGVGSAQGYQPTGYMANNNSYYRRATPKRTLKYFNNYLQTKYTNTLDKSFRKFKKTTDIIFTVDYKGNLISVEAADNLPDEVKSALFPIMESLTKWNVYDSQSWINRKKKNKKINTEPINETITVKFQNRRIRLVSQQNKYLSYYDWYTKFKQKDRALNNNMPIDSTKSGTMEYAFSSNKLGWINCDRFINSGKPLVNVPLAADTKNLNTDYKLVLKKINSIMPAYSNGQKLEFVNIPEGYEGTVLAIQVEDNKILVGAKDIVAGEPVGKIEMKEFSKQQLKELIGSL